MFNVNVPGRVRIGFVGDAQLPFCFHADICGRGYVSRLAVDALASTQLGACRWRWLASTTEVEAEAESTTAEVTVVVKDNENDNNENKNKNSRSSSILLVGVLVVVVVVAAIAATSLGGTSNDASDVSDDYQSHTPRPLPNYECGDFANWLKPLRENDYQLVINDEAGAAASYL